MEYDNNKMLTIMHKLNEAYAGHLREHCSISLILSNQMKDKVIATIQLPVKEDSHLKGMSQLLFNQEDLDKSVDEVMKEIFEMEKQHARSIHK